MHNYSNKTRSRAVENNRFAGIPAPNMPRSMFKRKHGNKFTFNEGDLIPIHCDEVYAGDTLNGNMESFIRLTTPLNPVMDSAEFDLHAFFVPSRLVMSDYYKMFGERVNPSDSIDFTVPEIESVEFAENSLADYFGLPTKVLLPQEDMPIALPFRAYNLIYNDWFRDENLQDSLVVKTAATDDNISLYSVKKRNKKHDYFTSCLPEAQKGQSVNIPLGTTAPITHNTTDALSLTVKAPNIGTGNYTLDTSSASLSADNTNISDPTRLLYADLTEATAVTINDLRNAISIQHILERQQRGGTRDVEILQNMYSVSPSDSRLQRPELIAVSRGNLKMDTIAQTSATQVGNTPLGELSAMGTINASMNFTYSAVENGYLIILASVRAEISYQQGIPKMWSKKTYLDFMDPLRANIGEQPVLQKEIFASSDTDENNKVFGYLPNFDDLRYGRNIITGQFRSNATNSLQQWHFSEQFQNAPVLSPEFIEQSNVIDRVLAVENNPDFFGDMYLEVNHTRVLPMYGTPGLSRL